MFRRDRRDTLPSTTYGGGSSGGGLPFGGGSGSIDGSGRSIKMDAPVVKAWKKASGYTKWTYYLLGLTTFLVFYGFRSLMYWNASIWLTCHQQECTLEITPPGTRTKTVVFPRSQLDGAEAIKTDKAGHFIEIDTDKYEPSSYKAGQKKKKNSKPKSNHNHRGPDEYGKYKTYRINILKESPESRNNNIGDNRGKPSAVDFSPVKEYLDLENSGMYSLHMRHFSLSQTRMRVRSNVNKVESYTRKRRQRLIIKESATLPWQYILCLVFGLVGLLLILLIGQFWDSEPTRQGGPGTRRSSSSRQSMSSSRRGSSSRTMSSSRSSSSGYRKNY